MKEVFPIVPASSGPLWFFWGFAVFMVALTGVMGYIVYSSRHATFEVSSSGLRIRGSFYGREIPWRSLIVSDAKALDLKRQSEYRPRWRTNGAGLPGYQAGWFKLRNGEKALLFVTDSSRVVYIPTREGYSVLLSVARPEAFRESLRLAGH